MHVEIYVDKSFKHLCPNQQGSFTNDHLAGLPRPDLILESYQYAFFFIRQAEPSLNKVIFAEILYT
jgi:hypothetical protein